MWTAELYIYDHDSDHVGLLGEPDAFYTADTKQKAVDGIMHYVMTMCEDTDKIAIKLTKE
ncbi:MAG: hypothetical protein MJ156_00340 [Alphaproteobacteria bacterium]|nr:hypothetical protein [Alphaproteobacteria bacterium]